MKGVPFFLLLGLSTLPLSHAQMPGMPPSVVRVAKVTSGVDSVVRRSIGRTEAIRSINVSTAVEGFLLMPEFEEGAIVNEGDVIFRIFPNRYQAAVEQTKASIAELDAQLVYAQSNYKRLASLSQRNASSQQEADTALASLEELKALRAAAEAELVRAQRDLDDCTIRAEITGRIGRIEQSPGNYIQRGSRLTTIMQVDPIYMRFPLSQSDVQVVFRGAEEIGNVAHVRLVTAEGGIYPYEGKISIVNNQLSSSSDTYSLWAEFPNPFGKLTPEGIGALEVKLKETAEVAMVPLTAVHYDTKGSFVYIVDENGIVSRRDVISGAIQGNMQTVYDGLKRDEIVISDGAHKVRPGVAIRPAFAEEEEKKQAAKRDDLASQHEHAVATVKAIVDPTVLRFHGAQAEAINRVEILPLVQGILAEPHFKEGDHVKRGEPLFRIDPTRYQAAVDAQQARIAQLKVRLADAQVKVARQEELFKRQAGSRDTWESAKAAQAQLEAQLKNAEAQLIIAQDDLSRCTINAPIDGLIGRVNVSKGNYITSAAPLATLVSTNPIYVRFALSESDILSNYGPTDFMKKQARIELQNAVGQALPLQGRIAFCDNKAQAATGTMNIWAIVDNPDGAIQPGSIMSVNITRDPEYKVCSVPAEAVIGDSRGYYVYILKEGRAKMRRVLCGSYTEEGERAILIGLEAGEQVLASNTAELEDGMRVRTEGMHVPNAPVEPAAPAQPAATQE